jgi:hypothetical protein
MTLFYISLALISVGFALSIWLILTWPLGGDDNE